MGVFSVILAIVAVLAIAVLVVAFIFYSKGDARFKMDIGGSAPRAAGGNDTSGEERSHGRLKGLGIFGGGVIVALLARLWDMQVLHSDDYTSQAESNRTRTISVAAPRGRILDRNGVEIVSNRPSETVVASSDVASNDIELQLLGNLIGMPTVAVKRNIEDTTEGAQSARKVASDVSRRVVAFIGEHPNMFDGVDVEQRTSRYYPMGNLAAHVVGYTGTVTNEQLDASNNSDDEGAIEYESGDIVGQSGVEYQYENVLQGVRGEQDVYVDANGNVLDYSTYVAPTSGSDVVLTIDAALQKAAEESLANVIKLVQKNATSTCNAGSVVCLDVTNGEVLAMASAPTFSPNIFVGGISNDDWTSLSSEENGYPLLNRVISGQYPSASTIKPIVAFAALDNGICTADTIFDCTGWWTGLGSGAGQWCWKHSGHGNIDLQNGITYSCDVVFYEIGKGFYLSSEPENLQAKFKEWGLGSKKDIDLPSEGAGRVPTPEWKWEYYSNYSDDDRTWKGGDWTNLCIGQGDLLVTPLQMACAYMGIANGGTIWRPHVLKCIKSAAGTGSVVDYVPSQELTVSEDSSYMELVHQGLQGVIYKEAEWQTKHWETMSETIAGKSGTAEVANKQPTGWFVAYAPADNPKYVVASAIEDATWGSNSAMYVVRDVMGAIFGEPDTVAKSCAPISSSSDT